MRTPGEEASVGGVAGASAQLHGELEALEATREVNAGAANKRLLAARSGATEDGEVERHGPVRLQLWRRQHRPNRAAPNARTVRLEGKKGNRHGLVEEEPGGVAKLNPADCKIGA